MEPAPFTCSRCRAPLPVEAITEAPASCPGCGTALHVVAFPALLAQPEKGETGEGLHVDDDSACFYHPKKQAVVPCGHCGRFLCALCDVEMRGEHLCPACVEEGVIEGRLGDLKTEYVRYDSIALTIAVIPAIFLWPSLVAAPMALYLSLRHWKTRLSIVPRVRWRFIAAIALSLLQLIGWGFLFTGFVSSFA